MTYIYTYARHEDEAELCELELQSLLGTNFVGGHMLKCDALTAIDVNRSPFLKRRIQVVAEAAELNELEAKLVSIDLSDKTFKVLYTEGDEKVNYEEQRRLEYTVGSMLRGKAEMRSPEKTFGLIRLGGRWLFGPCVDNEAIWLKQSQKPQNYSTALPARAARAIVNIASGPNVHEVKLIDPCCGMGTVLIEALSMGIDIHGMDINPLAVRGARNNLAHFGYPNVVAYGDMCELADVQTRTAAGHSYDAAILDMPYNLCSVLREEEQLAMLESVRQLARRTVVITTTPIERQLMKVGFRIKNNAVLRKASFARYVTVVE